MKVDGACHCGRIRYEAEVDPRRTVICHCTSCQTISGAPYRVNVSVLAKNFHLTGKPKIYVKIGGSGLPGNIAFCGDCGAAIYSCRGDDPAFYWLRTGAIRQRDELVPMAQGFCDEGMPWARTCRACGSSTRAAEGKVRLPPIGGVGRVRSRATPARSNFGC